MILVTTPTLEGHPVKQYVGVVTAVERLLALNPNVLAPIHDKILKQLTEKATKLKANAVLDIKIVVSPTYMENNTILVTGTGTAVII